MKMEKISQARQRVLIFILGLLTFCSPVFTALADPLEVLVSPRPPYYVISNTGTVDGIVARPAKRAFARAGIDIEWTVVSFNRQLQMIEGNGAPLCSIGWFRNSEREAFAKFTNFIYQDRALVALTRADNRPVMMYQNLNALLQEPSLKMGSKLGFSFGSEVDALIEALNPTIVMTDQTPLGMARMLIGERFDYMISAPEEATHLIEALGDDGRVLTQHELVDLMPRNRRYIMCSQSVDDSIIERLNAVIPAIRE